MSGGLTCKCPERWEPITPPGPARNNRAGRLWRVLVYKANYSAFNGYRHTTSDYSAIRCLRCGASWRSKAAYVEQLSPAKDGDINIVPGTDVYAQAMEAFGRPETYQNYEGAP